MYIFCPEYTCFTSCIIFSVYVRTEVSTRTRFSWLYISEACANGAITGIFSFLTWSETSKTLDLKNGPIMISVLDLLICSKLFLTAVSLSESITLMFIFFPFLRLLSAAILAPAKKSNAKFLYLLSLLSSPNGSIITIFTAPFSLLAN